MVTVRPQTEERFQKSKRNHMVNNEIAVFSNSKYLDLLLDLYDKQKLEVKN